MSSLNILQYTTMELEGLQSISLPEKKIDIKAKEFIKSAYNVGISVKLINRFLRESNYACTRKIVQDELKAVNIAPKNYNCSRYSSTGKRYLTHILDTFKCNTLERFAEIALNEAKTFYDFNENTFGNYWHEFCKFQNQLIIHDRGGRNIYKPANNDWVMHAFTFFGYTLVPLSNYLTLNNNSITPNTLIDLYQKELKRTDRNYIYPGALYPKIQATTIVKNFWKCCRQIGKEFDTIVEWTVIFLGQNFTETAIRELAHIN